MRTVQELLTGRFRAKLLVLMAAVVSPALESTAAQVPLVGAVAIEAGDGHACALMPNGGVQCWGANSIGQLGDGAPATLRNAANYVQGLSTGVAAIGAGGSHTCAIMAVGGGVKCWGSNSAGQLGNGTSGNAEFTPVDVIGLGGAATALALGGDHTCAILADKTVKCWGDAAAVGHGAASPQVTPLAIPGLASVANISAGPSHTCVTLENGAAKCWGENGSGELGNGATTDSPVAVDVASLSSGVAGVSAGGSILLSTFPPPVETDASFTCALTVAGGVKCWGANFSGQLGEGSTTSHPTPFDVTGLASGVLQVAAGGIARRFTTIQMLVEGHACAVTNAGGVKCWGSNNCAQLGTTGSGCGIVFSVPRVYATMPQDVPGLGTGVSAIAAGGAFNCVLMSAGGAVKCWGGMDPPAYFVTPAPVLSGTVPQAIVVRFKPASVAVTATDVLWLDGGPFANLIALTSLTPATCSVSSPALYNRSGSGTFSATVTGLAQGKCIITLNQAGSPYYDAAPQVTIEFRVGDKLPQTITFDTAPASVPLLGVGIVGATASSGLPVTFASNTPSFCSVSGNIVTASSAGQCTISAMQAGDDYYLPAPQVTQTFPTVADPSTYPVIVSKAGDGAGTVTSTPPGISCGNFCAANFTGGSDVSLSAVPSAGSIFIGWSGACSGRGGCNLSVVGPLGVTATFLATSQARLGNISTLANALAGGDTMIGGFVIGGTASKKVAIVATGPSLAQFGIANPLANPALTLVRASDGTAVASNDDWQQAANQADLVAANLAPADAKEAAILVNLAPGAYTAIVGGADGGTGVSVIGVYEVDEPGVPLVNISTRGRVGTGSDVMIGGFVIQGSGPQTVAIVATGPSLQQFGIGNPLANPRITLVRSSDQAVIATNDNWGTDAEKASLEVAGLAPSSSLEAGLYRTLAPGAYTVVVQGDPGTAGVAVIGIYKVN